MVSRAADISDTKETAKAVADRPDVIFHLAAIVSGEAELDFDKGYRINLIGTRLLEAIRRTGDGYHPKVVFTSSIAVFGAPFPHSIPRRLPPDAAHVLRHAEGDRRIAACRLCRRLLRRRRYPPADHLRAARQTEHRRRPVSSPASSASRWPGRRRSCR